MLQDGLNTNAYTAHGGTISLWNSGSRFAAAGQNKVTLADGTTPAPGLKTIHFGSPNEYEFEYLMSGGDNSLHVRRAGVRVRPASATGSGPVPRQRDERHHARGVAGSIG